jgi:hypothetical protein
MTASTLVTIQRQDGQVHRLSPGARLKFGRSRLADIVIVDRTLSRLAGELHAVPSGVEITNLSTTHVLEVMIDGRFSRLVKRLDPAPPASLIIAAGKAKVGSPGMHRQGTALTIQIEVPTGLQHLSIPTSPLYDDASRTRRPLDIQPVTKEFVTALMLCHDWLRDPRRSSSLPKARDIARACLEAVAAHHLLTLFDSEEHTRIAITSQIQDHIKHLKNKLQKSGLVPADTKVTTPFLAETLINLEILNAADLGLLDDQAWLSIQENLWWAGRPGRSRRLNA